MLKKIFFFIVITTFCQFTVYSQNTSVKPNAEAQFDQALNLFNDQQYNAAQYQFELYLKLDEKDAMRRPLATYYSAISSIYLFHEDGENQIKRFVDNYPAHPKAQEAYFKLGNFYYREKNYAKAIHYYLQTKTNILSKQDFLDYQFRMGYAYFSRKAFEEALPFFTQLKKSSNSYQSAAYYYSAYVNYELKNYEVALKDINEASQNDAYSASAGEIRANIYYKQGKYKDVIAYVNGVHENKMASGTVLIAADTYFALNDFQNALKYFQRYERQVKTITNRPILYRIGYSAYKIKETESAISYLEKVGIERDTLSQYSTYYLGSLYQEKGNTRFAINAFQQAKGYDFDPEISEESHWQLAVLLIKEAAYEQAINELTAFLKEYPQSSHTAEAKEYLTGAYLNTQAYDLAIGFLESLPSMTPQLKSTYQKVTFYQGAAYFNQAKYYDAVSSFQKSVKYSHSQSLNAEAYFWMGESYATGKNYKESIEAYEKANSLMEKRNELYGALCYGLAYSYYNTKQYSNARNYFQKYVNKNKVDTYYPDGLVRLADCNYVLKQYSEAETVYLKALKAESSMKDYITFQLGVVSSLQNNDKKAKKYFEELITRFPGSAYYDNALFQKALLTFETGNYNTAVDQFGVLLEKAPQSNLIPYALSKRAIAYFNLKQYELALVDYQHILRAYITHPTASGALLGLQEIYGIKNVSGDFDEYLAQYKQANPEDKEVATIEYDAAKTLYFNQNYERAIIAFKNYAENYPDNKLNQEVNYYLADSYYRTEQYTEALPILYNLIEDDQSQFLKRAISKIAEMELVLNNFEESKTSFNKLLSLSESPRDKYTAWSGLMEIAILNNQYDEIVKYADLIISQANINAQAVTKAYLSKGLAYFNQGKYELAKPSFLGAINTAKDENAAQSKYMLALMDYNEKLFDTSLEVLFELNKNYGSFNKWVGKSFLLIADNYFALGELFQAKATLNSIIENAEDDNLVNEAKIKMEFILNKEKVANKVADSLFQQNKADSMLIETDSIND